MTFDNTRTYLLVGMLSLVAFTSTTKAEDQKKEASHLFKSPDIFELEYANDPRISPDGRQIVYVRNSMDIMSDSVRGNLWIINFDGSGHRALLSSRLSYSSPRWSKDGGRLAYISSAEGSPQLYVRWMDTGQSALLTNLTESPGAISWSPDGLWIAFTMQVAGSQEPLAKAPAKPDKANWAPPVKLIDKLVYRVDGHGFLKTAYSHVFIVSAEGGTPRQLTQGDFNHDGPLSWTPDSENIVFSANRNEDWEYQPVESDIYIVSRGDAVLTQLTTRLGPDSEPVVSPDGRQIAYTGFDDREQGYQLTHLYVMDIDGSNPRTIGAEFDRSVQNPQWAGNGKIYFQHDDRGVVKLASITPSGKLTILAENIGGTTIGRPYTSGSYTLARTGAYATTVNSPYQPADVAVGRQGKSTQLTHLNDDVLSHKKLAQVESLTWSSSFDEREIQGWLVTPPDFDASKKYPFILEIHGGPFAAYGPNFSAEIQRYAAEGYVVLYANPRGSTSYGEEFGNLIHHAYPGNDYDDLMSGVDAVINKGKIDKDNLFVTGGSGGGVLSAWIVGKTGRFQAAVVAKPVINMTSFALTSDYVNYFYKYWFTAFPWEKPDEYWNRSPLSLVGNVTTPTMLLSGESDFRTPISESEQFYIALKLRKIDTALLRVPEASHGIANRPSNLIAKVDNILAWFDRYRTDKKKDRIKE
ncbi:MAG: dipeptidyl aminopeptidase/acylaminoacyl peptidase [Planctomycetota bacterium]|jgi:dipeptidyl aminopeptidase/acylaminoacyl peptidase